MLDKDEEARMIQLLTLAAKKFDCIAHFDYDINTVWFDGPPDKLEELIEFLNDYLI